MTDKQTDALKFALKVLNDCHHYINDAFAAYMALEAALAEESSGTEQLAQQQEPVAAPPCPDCDGSGVDGDVGSDGQVVTIACSGCAGSGVARYRGKCQEGRRCLHGCLIGESCYHKRYTSPQPAQQQEPVAERKPKTADEYNAVEVEANEAAHGIKE